MEAKDTMKTYGELRSYCIRKLIHTPSDEDLIQAQVEITWDIASRVGYKQGVKDNYKAGQDDYKAGIRDVVEGIVKDMDIPVRYDHNATCYDCIKRIKEKYIGEPN